MHLASPFKYLRPDGDARMFESFAMIQHRDFPLLSFLSNSEWNLLGSCPASYLKDCRADVMDV